MIPSIFLSHNWQDKDFARRLASDLGSYGIYVWIDEAEIQVGDSLIEKIRQGIDVVDYLAVILSPESVKSEWVKKEVDIAMNQEINNRRIKVLPILYRHCELPWFLQGKLYADFTNPENYASSLNKLLERLGVDDNIFMKRRSIFQRVASLLHPLIKESEILLAKEKSNSEILWDHHNYRPWPDTTLVSAFERLKKQYSTTKQAVIDLLKMTPEDLIVFKEIEKKL